MRILKIIIVLLVVSSSLKGMESIKKDLVDLKNHLALLENSLVNIQKPQPPLPNIAIQCDIKTKQPLQDPAIRGKVSRLDFPLAVNIIGFTSVGILEQAIGKPIKLLPKDESDKEIMGIAMGAQRIRVLIDELHSIYPNTKHLFLFFLSPKSIASELDEIAYAKQKNVELFVFDVDRDKKEILNTPHNEKTLERLSKTIKQLYN